MTMKSNPELITVVFGEKEFFQLQDTKEEYFKQGRVRRILDRYQSYFDNYNELLINSNINYVSLQELIEKINKALSRVSTVSLVVSVEIQATFNKTNMQLMSNVSQEVRLKLLMNGGKVS